MNRSFNHIFFSKKSYTLIEMLIVMSILVIVMPTVFSVIYILIQQQLRVFRVSETKRQGDRMLFMIKDRIVREAADIYTAAGVKRCASVSVIPEQTSDGNDFVFARTKAGMSPAFRYRVQSGILEYSDSSSALFERLHTSTVTVTDFQLQCIRKNSVTNPIVGVNFVVTFVDKSPTAQEGAVSFSYHTKVALRR